MKNAKLKTTKIKMSRRFTVTLDLYLYADNDKEAIKQANELAKKLSEKEDNGASVLAIHETPFASLVARPIIPENGNS